MRCRGIGPRSASASRSRASRAASATSCAPRWTCCRRPARAWCWTSASAARSCAAGGRTCAACARPPELFAVLARRVLAVEEPSHRPALAEAVEIVEQEAGRIGGDALLDELHELLAHRV